MCSKLSRRGFIAAASGAVLAPLAAKAGTWPDAPIRLIVPFPAGGGLDFVGRVLANSISPKLGQSIVVENKTGAGSAIGTEAVFRAAPDGLTFGVTSAAGVTLGPLVRPTTYDPMKLTHVQRVVNSPYLLVANKNAPYNNAVEFTDYLRKSSDKVNFASAGVGTGTHVAIEWINQKLGTHIVPVHYRGAAPAITDVIGGTVDVLFSDVSAWPLVQQGTMKLIAVSPEKRWHRSPSTASISEAIPGVAFDNWYGIAAPPELPVDITKRMEDELRTALGVPDVVTRLATMGFDPAPLDREPFTGYLRQEVENWRGVIASANIRVND